ncbi:MULTISPECIES: fasciclin domain-containing protein [unclassified Photobacterium]|uniref:fasciclin domain-containing protein n=1 Tax=unclassified Photobacterium TaxID=2628852 RepID=UPI000D17B818|nr:MULTISPECIES: fasciclin domain-containing protein [unclassified Photobacterium]PSV30720.1 fasciclin [Photobacterium sp. GB-27]PSV42023.1 fasciclin [Photobacterium sp. GB-36]PSV50278.1 fasciclin [Photobacterium sp. GB-1]PSV57375.1 fasciclin [Photobacterium sp. GB-3]PSW73975.1 fasciclin [Photobacterium sp. GB-50]
MLKTVLISASILVGSLVSVNAQAGHHGEKEDIVDIAVGNGSFNTLVTAVKAAGLVDTLKGTGPFTVLAPTDEAFSKLPAGTVETLLKPENKQKLIDILTYHVISGKVMADDVVKLNDATTLEGQKVNITVDNGNVMINDAKVINADVKASNGVIHVIDSVLIPSSN